MPRWRMGEEEHYMLKYVNPQAFPKDQTEQSQKYASHKANVCSLSYQVSECHEKCTVKMLSLAVQYSLELFHVTVCQPARLKGNLF